MQKKTPEKENKEKPLPAADSAVPNRQRHAGSSDEPAPNGAGAEAKTAPPVSGGADCILLPSGKNSNRTQRRDDLFKNQTDIQNKITEFLPLHG